ncbi:MAG: ABC transporter permease subunit [Candidatus Tectomicrobia bacterium]|nr:ABC transporter permease subunit [Candidatus Tectomicrobia bacterium]
MPWMENIVAMLGLQAACNPEEGGSEQLFALNREVPNFPSLDQFSAACPALPRIRDLQKAIDTGYKNFTRSWGDLIESFFNPFLDFLIWTENLLVSAPWWLTLVVITAIVYLMTRQRLHTGAVVAVLGVIGFFGMWDDAMRTLSFILVCTLICILFGIPIGVLMARHSRVRATVTPVLDVMQTMPSFVYLIPVVMLFGVGKVPGAIAVIAYAIPPVIRLTDLGIRLVDREVLEASEAFGASSWQRLMDVQIPLALPNILAGVNQTIMMALAMVVIASMVSVRGLGIEVLEAVTNQYLAKGLFNGLAVVAFAIMFDRVTRQTILQSQKYVQE